MGVSSTRDDGWFQKVLYAMMAVLGIYILYKGGSILLQSDAIRQAVETGGVQKFAEDAAVTTYAPGYAAAVEGKKETDWLAEFMKPLVPVYSYLAGARQEEKREAKQIQTEGMEETSQEVLSVQQEAADHPQKAMKETGEGAEETGQETLSSQQETADVPQLSTVPGQGGRETADRQSEEQELSGQNNQSGQGTEPQSGSQTTSDGRAETQGGSQTTSDGGAETQGGSQTTSGGGAETQGTPDGGVGKQEAAGAVDQNRKEVVNGTSAAGRKMERGQTGEEQSETEQEAVSAAAQPQIGQAPEISGRLLEQVSDFDTLLAGFYTMDAGTAADEEILNGEELLAEDLSIQRNPKVPQILIYHTHSQETFIDSAEGDESMSIVGMGEVLAELLRTRYGYQVIHDTSVYDLIDGVLDRSKAYDYAREGVEEILTEYPTIEVVIDLHRDGVEGHKFVTEINGKPTSMIMFFNGLSRNEAGEPLTWLANPYLKENLAFSLQLQLRARQQYPDFTRNIYLKAQRYNLHLRPRSLLIEAGTQLNTVEEERNAMEPLADLLAQVLGGVAVLKE